MKKVSVIIPIYNEEKDIEAALHALLKQNYEDFEIIVVNNASTDNSAQVVQRIIQQNPNKIILVDEINKGTQWARERGRKEACGEIIANLDADCLPETDWISNGAAQFKDVSGQSTDEPIIMLTGPYDYYDAKPLFRNFSLFIQKYIYPWLHQVLNHSHKGGIIIEGNVFFKADVLSKVGGYNTSYTFYGDGADMAKRISPMGNMIFDKNFIVKTSARRFQQHGFLKISFLYFYNFFKARHKCVSQNIQINT